MGEGELISFSLNVRKQPPPPRVMQGRAKDVVRSAGGQRGEAGGVHEERCARAVRTVARPAAPAHDHRQPQCHHGRWHSGLSRLSGFLCCTAVGQPELIPNLRLTAIASHCDYFCIYCTNRMYDFVRVYAFSSCRYHVCCI